MARVRQINFKIGNMRRAVDWVVCPRPTNVGPEYNRLFVQSDKRALSIDLETKKGMLSNGKGHPGFHSTMKILGAIEVDVPDEIIELCTEAQPKPGDTMGSAGTAVVVIG